MWRIAVVLCLSFCSLTGWAKSPSANRWISITPQNNLDDWTRLPVPPGHPLQAASQWSLDTRRRAILCRGDGGHEWLRYNHTFKDFLFEVQWRLDRVPGPEHYNSGVFVRTNEDSSIWYQAQVGAPGAGYFFGDNPENGTLKRFDLKAEVTRDRLRPPGQWNTYKIRCVGQTLTLWVNGVQQSEFTHCNYPVGYLGLEAEGSPIEFRHLRVKVLP